MLPKTITKLKSKKIANPLKKRGCYLVRKTNNYALECYWKFMGFFYYETNCKLGNVYQKINIKQYLTMRTLIIILKPNMLIQRSENQF